MTHLNDILVMEKKFQIMIFLEKINE